MLTVCKILYLTPLALLAGCLLSMDVRSGPWIDLTHEYSQETLYWPTSEPFRMETVFEGEAEGGYHYSAYKFCTAEHGGTHIDAPIHFAAGKQAVDEISLERLIGDAVVVDVSKRALGNRDYQIDESDLIAWEKTHGEIPPGAIVLLRTGHERYWPDAVNYLGTDRRGADAVKDLHFPGLHPDAARWLTEHRSIDAIGIDTASIDYGQSTAFLSHRILCENDVPVFENLAELERLPPTGTFLIALPMKIKGGSGGPLRIVGCVR